MKPKVQFKKVRSTGEIFEDSILFLKQNFKPLLKAYAIICGFFILASAILAGIYQVGVGNPFASRNTDLGPSYFLMICFMLLSMLFTWLTTLSYIALYDIDRQPPTVEEVWSYVKYYFWRMLGSTFILSILLMVGFLLCLLPGVYLLPIFSLALVIIVLDNTSLFYALNQSFKLIKSNWGNLFGLMLAAFFLIAATHLLALIVCMIPPGILVFLIGKHELTIMSVAFVVVTNLVQFFYMLIIIAVSMFYFSLTENAENSALLNRIQQLGQLSPDQPRGDEEY